MVEKHAKRLETPEKDSKWIYLNMPDQDIQKHKVLLSKVTT